MFYSLTRPGAVGRCSRSPETLLAATGYAVALCPNYGPTPDRADREEAGR